MQKDIAFSSTDRDMAQVSLVVCIIKRTLPNHPEQFSDSDVKNIGGPNSKPYVLRDENGKIVGVVVAGMEEDGIVHIGPLAVATNQQVQRLRKGQFDLIKKSLTGQRTGFTPHGVCRGAGSG